jgi:hypothetical protein
LLFNNPTQIKFDSFVANFHESSFIQTAYDELKPKIEKFYKNYLLPKKESKDSLKNIKDEIQKNFESSFKDSYLTNRLPSIKYSFSKDFKEFF